MKKLLLATFMVCSMAPIMAMAPLTDPCQSFMNIVQPRSRMGIYCGTFDPIHLGHTANIDYCLANGLDYMIVHVGSSPEKPGATDRRTRFEMTKAAIGENQRIFVSMENLESIYAVLGQKNCQRISIWGSDNMPRLERSQKEHVPCEGYIILPSFRRCFNRRWHDLSNRIKGTIASYTSIK